MLGYITYLVVPNHFSLVIAYFLLWWVGAMLAKAYLDENLSIRSILPEASWMLALILAAIAGVVIYRSVEPGVFPFLMVRHFVVAALISMLLLTAARRLLARLSTLIRVPAAQIAGLSYGLYVLHVPILVQTGVASTWMLLPAVLVTLVLSYLADTALARWLSLRPNSSRTKRIEQA